MAFLDFLPLLGSVANAAANLFGVTSTDKSNERQVKMANQANLDLYREQYSDSIDMWKMQNEYNTPKNQMSRLSAAGLNPALAFGAGQAGNAQAMTLPQAHPMQAAMFEAPSFNFSDIAQNMAFMSTANKQNEEAKGIQLDNLTRNQMNITNMAEKRANIKNLLAQAKKGSQEERNLRAELDLIDINMRMAAETFDERKESYFLANQMSTAQISVLEEQAKAFAADAAYKDSVTILNSIDARFKPDLLRAAIQDTLNSASLKSEMTDKTIWETFNEAAKHTGLNLDNQQKRKIMPYIVKQAKLGVFGSAVDIGNKALSPVINAVTKGSDALKLLR